MSTKSKTFAQKKPAVYIRTFGCQMNDRDSEIIYGLLLERGWRKAESIEADCILFNTCSVRHHAEQRAYSNMGSLARRKRRNPNLILGFIGCTAQKDKDLVFKRLPHVDLIVGPGDIYNIPDYLDSIMRGEKMVLATDGHERPNCENPTYRESKSRAYVSISEGCDNFCSYCIVPYVRGRQKSRKSKTRKADRRGSMGQTIRFSAESGNDGDIYRCKCRYSFPENKKSGCDRNIVQFSCCNTRHMGL